MIAAFDHIATEYDNHFTHSLIGKAQRKLVLQYLEPLLLQQENITVLELNCGTGEDAKWMAEHGATVVATDVSASMIQQAEAKIEAAGLTHRVVCKQIDINNLQHIAGIEKFDLIFSNFGGLNCIAPKKMQELLQFHLPVLLNNNGIMVFVIMPKFCLWETIYHLIILKWKNAFRRISKNPTVASIGNNQEILTWYYSPQSIQKLVNEFASYTKIKPIGFFIPPSYLNQTMIKRKQLFKRLVWLENKIKHFSFLAYLSDHFYIEIELKNKPND